jgi:hypothetical protein
MRKAKLILAIKSQLKVDLKSQITLLSIALLRMLRVQLIKSQVILHETSTREISLTNYRDYLLR